MTNTPRESADTIKSFVAHCVKTTKGSLLELQRQAQHAGDVHAAWAKLEVYLQRHWPLHVLALLERDGGRLQPPVDMQEEWRDQLEAIRRKATEEASAAISEFPRAFGEECEKHGMVLDRASRHPKYSFADGFLWVTVDDRARRATLSDHEGKLGTLPADVGAVFEAVEREYKRLFDRPFDPKRFFKSLLNHYQAVVRKEGGEIAAAIPIRHITRRLGKNRKGFRSDEFLADLSRLVEEGLIEAHGWRLELQHTKDTSQGMLLRGVGGSGYIGYIAFKRLGHD